MYPRCPVHTPAERMNGMFTGKTVKEEEDSRMGRVRKHRTDSSRNATGTQPGGRDQAFLLPFCT